LLALLPLALLLALLLRGVLRCAHLLRILHLCLLMFRPVSR
jgi:hypothetical protein